MVYGDVIIGWLFTLSWMVLYNIIETGRSERSMSKE